MLLSILFALLFGGDSKPTKRPSTPDSDSSSASESDSDAGPNTNPRKRPREDPSKATLLSPRNQLAAAFDKNSDEEEDLDKTKDPEDSEDEPGTNLESEEAVNKRLELFQSNIKAVLSITETLPESIASELKHYPNRPPITIPQLFSFFLSSRTSPALEAYSDIISKDSGVGLSLSDVAAEIFWSPPRALRSILAVFDYTSPLLAFHKTSIFNEDEDPEVSDDFNYSVNSDQAASMDATQASFLYVEATLRAIINLRTTKVFYPTETDEEIAHSLRIATPDVMLNQAEETLGKDFEPHCAVVVAALTIPPLVKYYKYKGFPQHDTDFVWKDIAAVDPDELQNYTLYFIHVYIQEVFVKPFGQTQKVNRGKKAYLHQPRFTLDINPKFPRSAFEID